MEPLLCIVEYRWPYHIIYHLIIIKKTSHHWGSSEYHISICNGTLVCNVFLCAFSKYVFLVVKVVTGLHLDNIVFRGHWKCIFKGSLNVVLCPFMYQWLTLYMNSQIYLPFSCCLFNLKGSFPFLRILKHYSPSEASDSHLALFCFQCI